MLKFVPPEYTRGLRKIYIYNKDPEKKMLGRYLPDKISPSIEIFVDNFFHPYPKLGILIPYLGKAYIAETLYHEIGHHYQQLNKQMKKKYLETYAEKFSQKLVKKYLNSFLFIKVLYSPFLLWFKLSKLIGIKNKK